MSEAFVGRGWAYPVGTDESGGIALVGGDRELLEAIRLIIGTAMGERPMRPEFGCAIHDMVFGAVDQYLAGQIAYAVRQSLLRWEPRIDVMGVDVTADDSNRALVYIDICFTRRGTNDPRNLVFPFYAIPEEVA
ncbi:MAG: GPW/gp25 family protein [Acidimicrobiales bacterium]